MSEMIDLNVKVQVFPGHLAQPAGAVKGGVIVIHEVWGLNDQTKDIADRFAAEGYVALAPDLLSETDIASRVGTLNLDLFNPATRNEAQPKLRALMAPMNEPGFAEKTLAKVQACFEHLYNLPEVAQKVAINGYCFGGSYTYSLALHEPRLKAALPFYGHTTTDIDELKQIQCPVLAFYGEKDEGLMAGLDELKQAMQAAGVTFEAVVYPDCGHAFFNDTNPYAYNKIAATDAWQRVLSFLKTTLAN